MVESNKQYILSTNFINPFTREEMYFTDEKHLCNARGEVLFRNYDGSYDFVGNLSGDRIYYDKQYDTIKNISVIDQSYLRELWNQEPCQKLLLDSLDNLNGKKILLLGNGISKKELIFLFNGAYVVYSDLSWCAIESAKNYFKSHNIFKEYSDKIEFHAIDANHTPFFNDYFDVIYGSEFVHHIKETEGFLKEVYRCLKPGGICRFMDDGFSPIWQTMKNTILRPLQLYSHKHYGISPEDLVATKIGGFRQERLNSLGMNLGFDAPIYQRVSFFEYLLSRGTEKCGRKSLQFSRPFFRRIDNYLLNNTSFIKRQGIRLVWGFSKP